MEGLSSQGWTEWFLSSYAASVSHDVDEVTQWEDDDPHVSLESPTSLTSHSSWDFSMDSRRSSTSPYGPYTKTGRGGAGNFLWESHQQDQDIELQKVSSLSERRRAAAKLERLETGEAMDARRLSSQYMHVGRGGAGNYTQSNEIQSAKSPRTPSFTLSRASSFPVGRGGAGNLSSAEESRARAEQERLEKQRLEAEKRREQVAEQVDDILQAPPGAMLSTSRRSSMLLEAV